MDWTLAIAAFVVGDRRRAHRHGRRRADDADARAVLPHLAAGGGLERSRRVRGDAAGRSDRAHPAQTARLDLVRWLCVGSVPAAFCGVLIARALGSGDTVQEVIQKALGVALVIAAAGLFVRAYLRLAERAAERDGHRDPDTLGPPDIVVRPVPDAAGRRGRRPGRRAHVGGRRFADHHLADDAVPDPRCEPAGRHRPRPGGAAGDLGRDRAIALRRLRVQRDDRAAGRLRARAPTSARSCRCGCRGR